jgi:predicted Zn-dependent protease with MMP-like domain/predicted nucleic-acid-binding Zn-ribbon protein
MTEASNNANFEQMVEWAYSTLPQKVRNLPDFPGIQVADEMFEKMSKRRNWAPGTELLGCFSGIRRTQREHNSVQTAPDLIFVFRGPILRRSEGNLPAEVKQVVWHEVAHWLGYDEAGVKELGLSLRFNELARLPLESEPPYAVLSQKTPDAVEREEGESQELRCIKCYCEDVTCREGEKPVSYVGGNLSNPITVHVAICTCNSCGYEWDDEDTA